MAYWIKYNGDMTGLQKNWKKFTSSIRDYGCFCFLDGKFIAEGRGTAKDLIDQSCKNLHKCQTCITMDFDQGLIDPTLDGDCDLTSQFSFNLTVTDLGPSIECLNLSNSCKRALCECDKRFAFELATTMDLWDARFKSENFSEEVRETECRSTGGGNNIGKIDKCCGIYPYRFPYHSMSGQRQCCGIKTYDLAGPKKCCRDNVAREFCPEEL